MGLTFKEDCNDLRNSKAFELACELAKLTTIHAMEPNIDQISDFDFDLVQDFSQGPYDCVIVAVRHRQFQGISVQDLKVLTTPEGQIFDLHDSFRLDEAHGFWL